MCRLWTSVLFLLILAGCDQRVHPYNDALEQLSRKEFKQAASSLEMLAENGYAPAQFRLGTLYLYGLGVPSNTRQAAQWFEKAAQQDDVGGQYVLATLYLNGVGVPQSGAVALRWFRRLAGQGFVPAQYQVGIMYMEGMGVDKDNGEAEKWVRRAAEEGHPKAIAVLAHAYEAALLGLPKDPAQAAYWRSKLQAKPF